MATNNDGVRRVEKPWGYELIYAVTDRYCGTVLFVRAGEALSLQYHRRKDETIYVHEGAAEIQIGDDLHQAMPGRSFRIIPGTAHRLRAITDTLFLKVSTRDLDDVVGMEDRSGRAT
ncbi:MAG: cupin domain-containing protein [Gaiellaceae bacterium]